MLKLVLKILVVIICLLPINSLADDRGTEAEVTYYVTSAGAGTGDAGRTGGSWATALPWADAGATCFEKMLNGTSGTSELDKGRDGTSATAGGTVFYISNIGVYTLTGNITNAAAREGTGTSPYYVIGVTAENDPPVLAYKWPTFYCWSK